MWCTLLGASIATAQSVTPLLSELYPAPETGESEWIELYNPSDQVLSLAGWWLTDELTTPSILYTFSETDQLAPYEFRQVVLSTAKLNNTGDAVRLYAPGELLVDRLSYTTTESGLSEQRTALTSTSTVHASATPNADNPLYSFAPSTIATPLPTPTPEPTTSPQPTVNPTPSPIPTSSPTPTSTPLIEGVTLSEISACPTDGRPEWIELYNSGPQLTATNWRITDQSGNYRHLNGPLAAHSYTTMSWSGSLLNNTGDGMTVTTATGQIIDSASYETCFSGKTLIPDDTDQWIAARATPGEPNPLPSPPPSSVDIITATDTADTNNADQRPAPTANQTNTTALHNVQPNPSLPWLNPAKIQLETDQPIASASNSATRATPAILGAVDISNLQYRPWEYFFAILAGLFFSLAGMLPRYDSSAFSP
jgi:hypothetical protein